jgi:alkylhydroperoxidase family enzyme
MLDPVEGVWKIRPEQGAAALSSTHANWQHSILTTREREAARFRVAQLNGCHTCQAWRVDGFKEVGCDETFYEGVAEGKHDQRYSRREQLCIDLAERFSLSWTDIGDDFMGELHEWFSDEEIVDLLLCIGQYVAQGRLIHILDLDVVCPTAPASLAFAR